jgi:hypothetical protein
MDMAEMLRSQMQSTLTTQLDAAVQAGDIAAARKASDDLQKLAGTVQKPAAPAFSNADIRAQLKAKATWFGIDPRKSAKAIEYGKTMEPDAFKSAGEFADALIKAVEEDFKVAPAAGDGTGEGAGDGTGEGAGDGAGEGTGEGEGEQKPAAARRRTDAPSGEGGGRGAPRRASGPWTKLADAPKEVADQIKAQADKFTRNASKEQRDKFITNALDVAYRASQKGK